MPILITVIVLLSIAALLLLYNVVLLKRAMREIMEQVRLLAHKKETNLNAMFL